MKPCFRQVQALQQLVQPSPRIALTDWRPGSSLEHSTGFAISHVSSQHSGQDRIDGDCTIALLCFDGDLFTLPYTAADVDATVC